MLDHYSLTLFANAFPQYVKKILKENYWEKISITIDDNILLIEEMKHILNYLGKNLKSIKLKLTGLKCFEVSELMNYFIANPNNLQAIRVKYQPCANIIGILCKNFINLKKIDIKCRGLSSSDIILIAENVNFLESVALKSCENLNRGLKYLFKRRKQLKYVAIRSSSLSEM